MVIVPSLTAIERQVVLLSLNDGKHTIAKSSIARRIYQRMFGARPANLLADPRLEALRVFSVKYRINRELPCRDSAGSLLSFETMQAAVELISRHAFR